jgi:hypothetical protein
VQGHVWAALGQDWSIALARGGGGGHHRIAVDPWSCRDVPRKVAAA